MEETKCECGANVSCECETEEVVKDLGYWKKNAEEGFYSTPISVLRYIRELEKEIESIMSERIINNHEASILQVLNELDRKPLVMQLLVESEKCECGKSIFENLFDYPDIVDVIRDPLTICFDIAHYQISKGDKHLFSYTVITYESRGYEHPFYMTIEHEPETK